MMVITAVGVLSLGAGLALQYWSCDVDAKKDPYASEQKMDYNDYVFLKNVISKDLYRLEICLGIRDKDRTKLLNLTPLEQYNYPQRESFSHKVLLDTDYVKANQLCQSLIAMQYRLELFKDQAYYKTDFINKFVSDRIRYIDRQLLTYKQLHRSD